MDGSRLDIRTIALALLCLAAISFGAATLDTTTSSDTGFGMGQPGQGDQPGGERTPSNRSTGDSTDGRSIVDLDVEAGSVGVCVTWLTRPLTKVLILLALVGVFLLGRWYDDAAMGLGWAVIVGYPGFFVYLLFTSCGRSDEGFLELSNQGRPSQEGGGLMGGELATNSPSLVANLMLVVVVVLLGAVAVLVLTSDHDQSAGDESDTSEEADPEADAVDVGAIGAAAGRAADRLERDGEFENEVYRAWAEMTEPLSVAHPESSTPGEFAMAAVDAGLDREDVEHLTRLFADVRYGGADPTTEREEAAIETLRRIEAAYSDAGDSS